MKIRTTIASAMLAVAAMAVAQTSNQTKMTDEKLELTQEWDKTFPESDKVNHTKVTFHNRYGVTLAPTFTLRKTLRAGLPPLP